MLQNRQKYLPIYEVEIDKPCKLPEDFIKDYIGKQPKWGPIGYVTYKRTYARKLKGNRTEEFWQTLERTINGVIDIIQRHHKMVNMYFDFTMYMDIAKAMYKACWAFKMLPPGRGLWAMGTDFIKYIGGAPLNNCGFVSTKNIAKDLSAPFCWLMDMLMLGVGVGFDTKGANLAIVHAPTKSKAIHVIEDSREGWVEALKAVIDSYTGKTELPKMFYGHIRPAGEPISGFGGTASGPEPLRKLLEEHIPMILDPLVGQYITETAIADIANCVGKCVIAGNVRRSAEIAIGSGTDEFLNLKNPEVNAKRLQHHGWASNNTQKTFIGEDRSKALTQTQKNGEPGFWWFDQARHYGRMADKADRKDIGAEGCNPCGEQTLWNMELCNLVETFPANCKNLDDYLETLKLAYVYAKAVSLLPIHHYMSHDIVKQNMRLGISQSGIVEQLNKVGYGVHRVWCDEGYKLLRSLDNVIADSWKVNRSIKLTSVKPSGTVSLLAGRTPGIHYPIAGKYSIRRIRVAKNSPLTIPLLQASLYAEEDVIDKGTIVFEFPLHDEFFSKSEDMVSVEEQLNNVVFMQRWWADNQVSATIKFDQKEDGPLLKQYINKYESGLKAISFLPKQGHSYAQAPYETITKERYEAMASKIDFTALENISTHDQSDKFCDGEVCSI